MTRIFALLATAVAAAHAQCVAPTPPGSSGSGTSIRRREVVDGVPLEVASQIVRVDALATSFQLTVSTAMPVEGDCYVTLKTRGATARPGVDYDALDIDSDNFYIAADGDSDTRTLNLTPTGLPSDVTRYFYIDLTGDDCCPTEDLTVKVVIGDGTPYIVDTPASTLAELVASGGVALPPVDTAASTCDSTEKPGEIVYDNVNQANGELFVCLNDAWVQLESTPLGA